jgi:hypothetical protein
VPVPAKHRVGYGYYPRVKFCAHAHTRRVRYLRLKLPSLRSLLAGNMCQALWRLRPVAFDAVVISVAFVAPVDWDLRRWLCLHHPVEKRYLE